MIQEFTIANTVGLNAGVPFLSVLFDQFWEVRKKTKIHWVRASAVRNVNASTDIVRADVEMLFAIDAGSSGIFNSVPSGFNSAAIVSSPRGKRVRFGVETSNVFMITPVLPEGISLDLTLTFYNFGTPAAADTCSYEYSIGYEEIP